MTKLEMSVSELMELHQELHLSLIETRELINIARKSRTSDLTLKFLLKTEDEISATLAEVLNILEKWQVHLSVPDAVLNAIESSRTKEEVASTNEINEPVEPSPMLDEPEEEVVDEPETKERTKPIPFFRNGWLYCGKHTCKRMLDIENPREYGTIKLRCPDCNEAYSYHIRDTKSTKKIE